jgi:hypothetical protein
MTAHQTDNRESRHVPAGRATRFLRVGHIEVPGIVAWLIAAAIASASGLLISTWVLEHLNPPWVFIFGTWFFLACLGALFSRATWARIVWLNLAAIICALGIGEAFFYTDVSGTPDERYQGDYGYGYFIDHELLGYGPAHDREISVQRYVGDELVYDTVYGINADGLRRTPSSPNVEPTSSVLFFGGSVTFGEGVGDSESMPYRVGEKLGPQFQVYNFGFHGYGPHQMLAALEFGLADSVVDETVSDVIYQALPAHIARVAGLMDWDRAGPWYALNDGGDVKYMGSFADRRSHLFNHWLPALEKSALYGRVFGMNRTIRPDDVELYITVVARAGEVVRERSPNTEFHVLLWGYRGDKEFDQIYERFIQKGITPHLISDILPEYDLAPEKYQIGKHEPHPNTRAHDLIAAYVGKLIAPDAM